MKRLLCILLLAVVAVCALASCSESHHFGEWEITEEYTCTKDGKKVRTCIDCGATQTRILPARHTEEIDEAVDPTCAGKGLTEGKHCSVCEEIIVQQEEIAKLPHTYGEDGIICTVCGFNRETDCEHENIETLAGKEATCTEAGLSEGQKCLDCEEIIVAQEEIAALGHTEVIDVAIEATCTENGLTEGKHCSVCETVIVAQEETEKKPHIEVIDNAIAPTCTENGLTEGKHCSACETVIVAQEDVVALGHIYDNDEDEECNKCDFVREVGCKHSNVAPISGREANCTEAGLSEGQKCLDCEEIIVAQEEIAALGHTEVTDEAVESTCSKAGLTEGKHCLVCETIIVAQEETEKKPHTEVVDAAVEATCSKAGLTEGKHCSVCETIIVAQEETEKKPHTEVIDEAVEPTCSAPGLTEGRHCSRCNEIIVVQIAVGIIEHNYIDSVCSMCGRNCFSEGLEYTSNGDGTCWVNGIGTCTDSEIVIPEKSTNNDTVISIGYGAFKDCTSITSVTIPSTVTWIVDYSFYGCTNLEKINTPNGVTRIGYGAFSNCTALSEITIPKSVTLIEASVFSYCTSLECITVDSDNPNYTSIDGNLYSKDGKTLVEMGTQTADFTVPNQVSVISESAFEGRQNLNSVTFGNNLTSIGSNAFYMCTSLNNVSIPDNVTHIGKMAFNGCSSLSVINLGNGVTNIGKLAFARCTGLTSISLPDSITNLDKYAFSGCTNLTDITLGSSIEEICDYTFRGCTSLKNIVIPSNCKYILSGAFEGCTSLVSITIPTSLSYISSSTFYNCTNIENVYYRGSIEQWEGVDKDGDTLEILKYITVHCTDGVISENQRLYYSTTGLDFVSNGDGTCYVVGIGSCENSNVNIPSVSPDGDVVTGISLLGNWGMADISSVIIPDSVMRIEDYAFAYSHNIQHITIGKNVSYIGSYAFAECRETDEIQFNGTIEEWNNITKVNNWNIAINECTVHCIDGDVDASNYDVCT